MRTPNENEIRSLLKQSFGPANEDLQRDLWPEMLRRMDHGSSPAAVPWFDWALAAALVIMICAFPGFFPLLLYHL